MVKLPIKSIEKITGRKINKIKCLGLDTASRTGWAAIDFKGKNAIIDYGYIEIRSTDLNYKYNRIIDEFNLLIPPYDKVVIEDTFLRFNARAFKVMTRIGGLAYTVARLQDKEIEWMLAMTSRSKLGLPTKKKKAFVHNEFRKLYGIQLTDEDIIDAIILAIAGVLND